jgi:hypothetical protein
VSVTCDVGCDDLFASKPAPTVGSVAFSIMEKIHAFGSVRIE